jgi:hypothetical protein
VIRRLFTVAPALSLLLCAATCVLWARRHHNVDDILAFEHGKAQWNLVFSSERMAVNNDPQVALEEALLTGAYNRRNEILIVRVGLEYKYDAAQRDKSALDHRLAAANEAVRRIETNPATLARGYSVPYWAFIVTFLSLPVVSAIVLISGKRRSGCCLVCGYDLRASKDRCPECGTPIQSTAVPAEKARISN